MGSADLQHEFCLKTSLYIDNNFVSRRLCQMEFPYQGSGSDLTLSLSERIRILDSGSISVVAAMDPLDESIAETQTAHVIVSLLGQPCAALTSPICIYTVSLMDLCVVIPRPEGILDVMARVQEILDHLLPMNN